jgi:hypothetical protein
MNERIEKLWDEAADSIAAIPNGRNNFWETQENFMEKFAELIVRECCFVGEQYAEGLFDMKHYDFVNKKIKEHFGVE